MSNKIGRGQPAELEGRKSLREKIAPLLMVLVVIAITVVLFLFRDKVAELRGYGYLGAFLICLVASVTIILPMPGFLILFALGASLNPFFVGLAGATGGAIGEMTGYLLGYSGRGVVQNRMFYDKSVRWLQKWGVLAIFVFAITPSPFDVMGMVAGLLRYPFWKFFLACWSGKTLKYIGIALGGAWGWEAVLRWLA